MSPFGKTSYDDRASLGFLFLAVIAEFSLIMAMSKFVIEASPTKYRDYLGTRIAKLRTTRGFLQTVIHQLWRLLA
jgi:hypothetical protein